MTNIDKRLFYLMLSANQGQDFAKLMGFSPPSEDVEEIETDDILTRWAVFMHYGLLSEVEEAAEWFTSFLQESDKLISEVEEFKSVLIIFGVATINKILEAEKLAFIVPLGEEDE